MLRRAPLRRTGFVAKRRRIRPVSAKRKALAVQRTALLLGLKDAVGHRCEFCRAVKPLDGHEVRKPRRLYWLDPEFVVMLCRPHHDMAEEAFFSRPGRLMIPGTRSTGWGFYVVRASSQAQARELKRQHAPFFANGGSSSTERTEIHSV